eukprot:SAG11_NODE_2521_length_3261_cov_1.530993_2_plen_110_part_00
MSDRAMKLKIVERLKIHGVFKAGIKFYPSLAHSAYQRSLCPAATHKSRATHTAAKLRIGRGEYDLNQRVFQHPKLLFWVLGVEKQVVKWVDICFGFGENQLKTTWFRGE